MAPAYTLRRARDGDWHALYRLHHEAMGPHVEATWGPWDPKLQWRFFLSRVLGGRMQVVMVDGAIAGILEVSERADAVFIDNIELGEGFRGQGLGAAVLTDVMAGAQERGLAVELQVLHVNPARRLYERLGFRGTRETETHWLMRWNGAVDSHAGI